MAFPNISLAIVNFRKKEERSFYVVQKGKQWRILRQIMISLMKIFNLEKVTQQ